MNDRSDEATDPSHFPPVSPLSAALRCACPRCGNGQLYSGLLAPAPRCMACGLDYSFIDSGDGPAVFVILILGFAVMGLALGVETAFAPPIWLHAVLWIPLTTWASIMALRMMKAFMVALQFRTKAEEGRLQ